MAWPNVSNPNHQNYSRSPLHTHTCLFSFLSPIHAGLNLALAVESVSSPTQQKHSFPIDVARVHRIRRLVLLPLTGGGTIAGVFDGGSPHTCSGQFPPRLTRTGGCYRRLPIYLVPPRPCLVVATRSISVLLFCTLGKETKTQNRYEKTERDLEGHAGYCISV